MTEKLYNAGAILEIYDPMVSEELIKRDIDFYWNVSIKVSQDKINVLNKAPNFEKIDVAAILTEWDEFKNFDYVNASVFDGRNLLINKDKLTIGKNI